MNLDKNERQFQLILCGTFIESKIRLSDTKKYPIFFHYTLGIMEKLKQLQEGTANIEDLLFEELNEKASEIDNEVESFMIEIDR